MLGSIGHAGAYSFNYYKNLTAGEGGAIVTNDRQGAERAKRAIDPCHFYWHGRSDAAKPRLRHAGDVHNAVGRAGPDVH